MGISFINEILFLVVLGSKEMSASHASSYCQHLTNFHNFISCADLIAGLVNHNLLALGRGFLAKILT